MDQKFADNFPSISTRQARASGFGIYRAKRGVLDNSVCAQAVYRLNGRCTVSSRIKTSRLGNNAADSLTVRKNNQYSAGLYQQHFIKALPFKEVSMDAFLVI
jgi:outer membrane scaffolding protein for murein synthesis (MipA/OmpV family)